ncbi:hypothetical protein WA026_010305, partial [Henosepilachna vigintioctopunctata]
MPKRRRKRDSDVLSENKFKRNIPTEIRYDKAGHLAKYVEKPRRYAFCSTRAAPHKSRWSCSTCD